ncbi:diguanylate cyclase [Thiomicrospira sp. R3]|uniref:diguanylate cyclase domain-containing protein n=1 Tax=Thiomicrospira sp. R3 TaxID=3035472 RepID=UPI00259B5D26|nr:diguanylate cyclase [Thiomicrospira sp. R3]WFE67820.1 diguanylate cyclase [Thiomicrospira sp. R3]
MLINRLKNSIKLRVMLFSHLTLVILFVLIGLLVTFTIYEENKQRYQLMQQDANHQLALLIELELADRLNTLSGFAPQLAGQDELLTLGEMQALMDSRVRLHRFFNNGLIVTDAKGQILVDSPVVAGRAGVDASSREFIQQVLNTQSAVVTKPLSGLVMEKPIFNIAVPIFSESEKVVGVLFGVTLLNEDNFLIDLSKNLVSMNLSQFYVVDKQNDMIAASSNLDLVFQPLSSYAKICGLLQAIQGGQLTGFAKDAYGQEVMFSSDPVGSLGWEVVHAVSLASILAPVWPLLLNLTGLLVLLMGLILALVTWFMRRELQPLEESASQMDAMSSGLLAFKPIQTERQDELGRLISAFNRLLVKQQDILKELTESKQAAEQASQTKSEFLTNMSHEIPTPLGAVQQDDEVNQSIKQVAEQMIEHPGELETDKQVEELLASTKPRILIVDDEPANARVLANGLKDDYLLLLANSGEKALKLAQSDPQPDLVLLDIMMPDMDGYQVCRTLKNDPKTQNIPVVFVSALDQRHDEEKGLNMGAVDYISKPFHLPIVKSRIRNHLALKLKTDLLEEMSHMDGLTHIANRRQFDETLVKESLRLARSGKPLGLIMLDIDFFKPFNDHYGHGQGDICLQKVAQALQSLIHRPGDLLARYGGEEFVVLLPETGRRGTQRIAEELRPAVESLQLMHEYSAVSNYVTISVGAVSGWAQNQQQAEQMLKQADDALYQAKQNGRNRTCVV